MSKPRGRKAHQKSTSVNINPVNAADPDDLPSYWDALRLPPCPAPSQPEPEPEPEAAPTQLPRFPRLILFAQNLRRRTLPLPQYLAVHEVIRVLGRREREGLRSASRALRQPQYRVVATCLFLGLMARIVEDDPDLDDALTTNDAVVAFFIGFAEIFGHLPNGVRFPRPV
ncbi:hypothetical protein WMF27_20610 [Sorangium sp. So ce281]|uniref:hypothetical protein n=1 Tax=unclassified Sorangium TaxID=2621164 RepID=UPI003F611135